MSAHTPMPWQAIEGQDGSWPLVIAEDGTVICRGVMREEDARLITAAPELLATLQALIAVEDGEDSGAYFREALYHALRPARAAIAKATKSSEATGGKGS